MKARGAPPQIASRCAVFARTDLIHAQQEGYGLPEICKGLCQGLANIVADTLTAGGPVAEPLILAGGVAKNLAVRAHLEERLGVHLTVDEHAHLYGALGAALCLLQETESARGPEFKIRSMADLDTREHTEREYHHPPLVLELSDYPLFRSERRYDYRPRRVANGHPVEVDLYRKFARGETCRVQLGVDVGSTSTKAVLLGEEGEVLAGLYTRTAGRPITAMQAVFEAIDSLSGDAGVTFEILGAGTTGSGRRLIGAVIGADLIIDEITAHARAAFELDPAIDTIFEIGGQDAKFTTLHDGMVTSAVMNTVCAAGTGSFIEEQAGRLDIALADYPEAVEGARAPLASDRCTVFMQRDLDHLLASGYSVPEVLATVLHSVRENYLRKVAREGSIGSRIAFQGATAKNRALVAAFEQRLGKPIHVSRFCHLTGALGVAHLLAAEDRTTTGFRGVRLFAEEIPVRNEICQLCRNHCKIVSAEIMGEVAAYGFLCGRDYDLEKFVNSNRSGFDLLKVRRRTLRARAREAPRPGLTIGLPAALTVFDQLELWRGFFHRLRIKVVTSEGLKAPVLAGKRLMRAEFCAPMAAWHGHVESLLDRADYVFVPVSLEARHKENGRLRQYCYYSQYASTLVDTLDPEKIIQPLISHGLGDFQTKIQLFMALKPILPEGVGFTQVSSAYSEALVDDEERREELKAVMRRETDYLPENADGHRHAERGEDMAVVLLGRPYACLDPHMNKGIPRIIGTLGVKTFFQDMLTYTAADVASIDGLLDQVHWHYAARILEAGLVVARTPGLYPIFVTSFKCAPDSMTIEFFRRILDAEGKPYLILELDEHDSSLGYETRIEAAVRSFRNHSGAPSTATRKSLPIVPRLSRQLDGRIVFLPNWDRLSCTLLAANLRREGIDVRVLPEDDLTIRRGLRNNTGQCIPLNAIVEGFFSAVHAQGLDPAKTALWAIDSRVACNIGMFPGFIKAQFEARGGGFEKAMVYLGNLACTDISVRAALNTYFAYMFGGMLRRMACRVRPYELHPGEADAAMEAGLEIFEAAFERGTHREEALREVVDLFARIETGVRDRPKVAIFGDLYVRDNDVMSQDLIRFIERHGGEVITTPYSEYVKIVAPAYFQRWFREIRLLTMVTNGSLLLTAKTLERQYLDEFGRVLGPAPVARPEKSPREILVEFGITDRHGGESMDNILKIFHIIETDPDVSLFVQANPAFCCPSLVTEAMADRIRERTGIPVVTVTYDGTAAPQNNPIIPYLTYASRRKASSRLKRV